MCRGDRLIQQRTRQQSGLEKQQLFEAFATPLCWETMPPEEKKELYRALVERIVIQDGEIVRVDLRV